MPLVHASQYCQIKNFLPDRNHFPVFHNKTNRRPVNDRVVLLMSFRVKFEQKIYILHSVDLL